MNSRIRKIRGCTVRFIMFRLLFPAQYILHRRKKVQNNKVVFIEVRFDTVTDSFQQIYNRVIEGGYDVHVHYLKNIDSDKIAYIKRCLAMIRDIADAGYAFLNDACNVTGCLPLRPETEITQLWHACGAFKKFGMSTAELLFGEGREVLEKYPNYGNLKYVTVSSPEVVWAYEEAMMLKRENHQVVAAGVSRTDVFYNADFIKASREKLLEVFPEASGKKVILYAPTFRGRVAAAESPDRLDIQAMQQALGQNYILLVKHHPFVKHPPEIAASCSGFARDVTQLMEIDQLLCVSDICISDYSSLVFEYSLFERPMLFFAYDLEEYFDWRGFYYDYDELAPGPVVKDTAEVIAHIKQYEKSFNPTQVRVFKDKFMSACDGHATDRIMDLVFHKSDKPIATQIK